MKSQSSNESQFFSCPNESRFQTRSLKVKNDFPSVSVLPILRKLKFNDTNSRFQKKFNAGSEKETSSKFSENPTSVRLNAGHSANSIFPDYHNEFNSGVGDAPTRVLRISISFAGWTGRSNSTKPIHVSKKITAIKPSFTARPRASKRRPVRWLTRIEKQIATLSVVWLNSSCVDIHSSQSVDVV